MKIQESYFKGYKIEIHKEEDPGLKFLWEITEPGEPGTECVVNSFDEDESLFNSVKAAMVNAIEYVNNWIVEEESNYLSVKQ